MNKNGKNIILETNMPDIGVPRRGKVRDIYDLGLMLLLVITDRVSAFDVVLPNGIPGKGNVLNAISAFWFKMMKNIIRNHMLVTMFAELPNYIFWDLEKYRESLEGRIMLVSKAVPLTVECIVRGYLSGSGWKSYQKNGTVCGIKLPDGLRESDKLPDGPIFTPSTKAEKGHDINISLDEMAKIVGRETAERLKSVSLAIYEAGSKHSESKGIIIADTKMEFGFLNGELVLIDELLTPDSSRFWSAKDYAPGRSQDSFDKQIVRDYLLTLDWDQTHPGPKLPPDIVEKTANRYQEILQILTN